MFEKIGAWKDKSQCVSTKPQNNLEFLKSCNVLFKLFHEI
jgi:hypothetical protein